MEAIVWISACCALLAVAAAGVAVAQVVPMRGRLAQLELERPRFIAELEGMLDACNESLDRAEAKRKRADNQLRTAQRVQAPEPSDLPSQVPLRAVRGSYLEPLA